jgi:histidine triad (HIT) family protein
VDECFICRKHRGEVPVPGGPIYEDDLVYASHAYDQNNNPTPYLGHAFVEPKRHAAGLGDLTDEEAQALGLAVTRLARALRDAEGAEWVYSVVLGHNVPHLHVHLVPRYPGTPREHWDPMTIDEWAGARHGGPDEIREVVKRLRAQLRF